METTDRNPGAEVRSVIARFSTLGLSELAPDMALGSDGVGLDSIAIFEMLLECERLFGIPASELLAMERLTVGDIIGRAGSVPGR